MTRGSKTTAVLTVLVIAVLGYWLSYRPYAARKSCSRKAYDIAKYQDDPSMYHVKTYRSAYQLCLDRKGL